jgi:hypothetical protein
MHWKILRDPYLRALAQHHGEAAGRAPYLLPYVDPAVRCCIAPSAAQTFSRCVWELNAEIFANSDLRVGNLPPPARATMAWMGHDRLRTKVCRWHAAALPPTTDDKALPC